MTPAEQKAEILACAQSPEYFLEHYGMVRTSGAGAVPYRLWPHLRLLHQLERAHPLLVVLKARQIGLSWHAAGIALHTAMFVRASTVLLLSKRETDAGEMLDRARFLHAHLPPWLRVATGKSNESTLEFPGRWSKITALPSTEDAGRGETATLIVTDEYAFHAYAEANFGAIKPTIDAGGRMLIISTAHGHGNHFAAVWESASAGGLVARPDGMQVGAARGPNGFVAVFMPWSVLPSRDRAWLEATRPTYAAPDWAQEYPSTPDEAFVTSGRTVFPAWALVPDPDLAPLDRDAWPLALQSLEGLTLYRKPEPGHQYLHGADVSEGRADGDASCLVVLDADDYAEVAHYHGRPDPEVFADILDLVATEYAGIVAVEVNAMGVSTLGRLRDISGSGPTRYRLYRRVGPLLEPSGRWKPTHLGRLGWRTTTSTKPRAINDLHEGVRTGGLHLATPALLAEMKAYERADDGSTGAPGSKHDDRVMALAISFAMRKWVNRLDTDADAHPPATRVVGLHGW